MNLTPDLKVWWPLYYTIIYDVHIGLVVYFMSELSVV